MRTEGRILMLGLFGLAGVVAGLAGGWYAHSETSSWALAVFVFVLATYVIGRGLPDVLTDPDKGRRIAFFGLPPAIAVGMLAAGQWLWEMWWLSVTLGFVGYVLGFVIAMIAFPKIAGEEYADDLSRVGGRPGAPIAGGPSAPRDILDARR